MRCFPARGSPAVNSPRLPHPNDPGRGLRVSGPRRFHGVERAEQTGSLPPSTLPRAKQTPGAQPGPGPMGGSFGGATEGRQAGEQRALRPPDGELNVRRKAGSRPGTRPGPSTEARTGAGGLRFPTCSGAQRGSLHEVLEIQSQAHAGAGGRASAPPRAAPARNWVTGTRDRQEPGRSVHISTGTQARAATSHRAHRHEHTVTGTQSHRTWGRRNHRHRVMGS